MRISILLLTTLLLTTIASAQTFRWNEPREPEPKANANDPLIDESGDALYYADHFEGSPTALGETYHHHLMTAAHAKLPLGTIVKVTRIDNGLSTTVRINDRGAYCDDCVIDLSRAAAQQIDLLRVGRSRVVLTVLGYSNTNPPTPNEYEAPAVSSKLTARRPEASQTYTLSSGNPYNRQPAQSEVTARSGQTQTTYRGSGQAINEYQVNAPEDYSNVIPVRERPYEQQVATTTARTTAPVQVEKSGAVNILREPLTGYAIQLGSYGQYANAERHVTTLQAKGFNNLYVMPQARPGGSAINRVIVAPFQSIRQAEDYLADLKEYHQMEGLIIRM
ncbi:MAG: septal ring lytic transglycosylase RlpA family protein [Bacteroidota bacterium]